MALFLGKFEYVIDERDRVNIPARCRDQMAGEPEKTLARCKGMDGCIWIYPNSRVEAFLASFDKSQFRSNKNARSLQRQMADGGSTASPDGQGRISISEEQKRHAGLVRDVVIFGNFDRIEIWDPEKLATHLDTMAEGKDMDALASEFFSDHSDEPKGAKQP